MRFLTNSKHCICCFLFFIFFSHSFSQRLLSTQHSNTSGLASNTVHTVFIDAKNQTWIGTDAGVYMYISGQVYDLKTKNQQPILECSDIQQDYNQDLWFATYGHGLYKLSNGKTIRFDKSAGLINNKINKIYIKDNLVYIGTVNGLSMYNIETQTFLTPKINHFKKHLNFSITDFIEIENQLYFITPNDGLFKIINQFKHEPRIVKIRNHDYVTSVFLWNNKIYEGNMNAIKVFSVSDYLSQGQPLLEIPIANANKFTNRNDHLLVLQKSLKGNAGAIHAIYDNNSFTEIDLFDASFSSYYNSLVVNNFTNKAFLGTQQDGLWVFDLDKNKTFFPIRYATVNKIKTHKDTVFFVFNDRIEIADKNGKLLHQITQNIVAAHNEGVRVPIQFLDIEVLDDAIFFLTNTGKFSINHDLQELKKISKYNSPIIPYYGQLYDFKAHYKINEAPNFIGYLYANQPNQLPLLLAGGVVFDDKIVVYSKSNGLYLIENEKVKSLFYAKIFPIANINFIQKSNNNTLLVVTESEGIFELSVTDDFKKKHVLPAAALHGKTIYFVDQYESYFVVGTEVGVEFISDNQHFILNEAYGLPQANYSSGKVVGEQLYVGGYGGYFTFNIPDFLLFDNKIRKVEVQAIFDNSGQNILTDLAASNPKIAVHPQQGPLTIHFIPFTKKDSKGQMVRYRTNASLPWSSFSEEMVVNLTDLEESTYQIELEFLDVVKQTRQKIHLVEVQVAHNNLPLWLSGTFLLCIVAVCGYKIIVIRKEIEVITNCTILDFSLTNVQTEQNFAENNTEISIETKMLLNALNSHFIFNIISYFQYVILQNNTNLALRFNEQKAVFFRNLLTNAAQKEISLVNELSFIESYLQLERSRFDFDIDFRVDISENIDRTDIFVPPFILHPILEILLNCSFFDSKEGALIQLEILEQTDQFINVIYHYNGQSIDDIFKNTSSRFYKVIALLSSCLQRYNTQPDAQITCFSGPNGHQISFKIYVYP